MSGGVGGLGTVRGRERDIPKPGYVSAWHANVQITFVHLKFAFEVERTQDCVICERVDSLDMIHFVTLTV